MKAIAKSPSRFGKQSSRDSSLSFTAKNVKIITIGGKVTLRGPVKTDAERSAIEAQAKNVAGVSKVDQSTRSQN